MYRLVMDTALDYSYLAILENNKILYESYEKKKVYLYLSKPLWNLPVIII